MKQVLEHKKLGVLRGILVVLGLCAAMVGLSLLCTMVLARLIGGRAAALAFWILGAAMVLWLMQSYVGKYVYELTDEVLRLNRSYGKRLRHIEDIYLRQLLFVGSVEEAKQRYPDAHRLRVTRRDVDLPITALVYRDSKGERTALVQVNSEFLERLNAAVRENRKK